MISTPHFKRTILRMRAISHRVEARRGLAPKPHSQAAIDMAVTDSAADACLLIRELMRKRSTELLAGTASERIAGEELANFAERLDVQTIISCCESFSRE